MSQKNVSENTAEDLSRKTGDVAKKGAKKGAKAAKKAVKKMTKKLTKQLVKFALKIAAKIALIILKLLMIILPYVLILAGILTLVLLLSSYFVDEEYESKAEQQNYQTEKSTQDNRLRFNPETGKYEILSKSNGNKLFKMFYGYNAQKGYYKVVVDENGKTKQKLVRGDTKAAKKIVDKFNREKEFALSSDLLYLLDNEMNSRWENHFFFPEQFTQPVYHDKNYNLKNLTDKNDEIVAESTKYKDGKATKEKTKGIWDYGFGSILQYQEYKEEREKRATLAQTYKWDKKKKKLVSVKINDSDDKVTEKVDGYPRKAYMIKKVTNAIGTIENDIEIEWHETDESWSKAVKVKVDGEKKEKYTEEVDAKNKDGKQLYWKFAPMYTDPDKNKKTTEKTGWKVTKTVEKTRWVPAKIETTKTYKGKVWEKSPIYKNEKPDTSKIVGDRYIFDYLTNYTTYVPDKVMESFDILERTGKSIEGLEKVFEEQEQMENAESAYDGIGNELDPNQTTGDVNVSGQVTGSMDKYNNANKFRDIYETMGKRYGVDPNLLLAIAAQESGGSDYIDMSRYGNSGVGLMQIIKSTGQAGISATNLETGKKEKFHLNSAADHTPENTVRFAAMYLQGLISAQHGNVAAAVRGYNSGGGAMLNAMKAFASDKGISLEEAYKRPTDEWIGYNKSGDTKYLSAVMQYYAGSEGSQPYIMDAKGTKYSMDGSVQKGAAIVGNGTSDNKNWLSSMLEALGDNWPKLFADSPTDALLNKDKYTFKKDEWSVSEKQYDDFIKMYWTFANDMNYSEVKNEITLEDWKAKYARLFENLADSGNADEKSLEALDEIMKLFKDGYDMPIEKANKISMAYEGTMIKLKASKGTDVKAMSKGTVKYVDAKDGIVEIEHEGGTITRYTNLQSIKVKKGKEVKKGQIIAETRGDLGLALMNKDGDSVDPTPMFELMGGDQKFNYQKVLKSIESVKGYPYELTGAANDPSYGKFDCSGLMQWAYKQAGISLPRTAQMQYDATQKISKSQRKPGDLVFIEGTSNHTTNPITHVVMYIGNGQAWNAQVTGGVKITSVDSGWLASPSYKQYYGRVK